jgi:hypothetical protein
MLSNVFLRNKKSEVKLAVNTDLTVKCHDLIHMAIGSHDIGPLIE